MRRSGLLRASYPGLQHLPSDVIVVYYLLSSFRFLVHVCLLVLEVSSLETWPLFVDPVMRDWTQILHTEIASETSSSLLIEICTRILQGSD